MYQEVLDIILTEIQGTSPTNREFAVGFLRRLSRGLSVEQKMTAGDKGAMKVIQTTQHKTQNAHV